jgi:cellulose synthase/poly-beta-1,6-N-acetylglucosamine synthase-like glycosyltransferase
MAEMLEKLEHHESDVVVANRAEREDSLLRTVMSRVYRAVFGGMLGLKVDVQSGLKVFRAEAYRQVEIEPSPWGFDFEFLYRAQRLGYRLGEVDIRFAEREHGQSAVRPVRTALELLWGAIKLRTRFLWRDLLPCFSYPHPSELRTKGFENRDDFLFLPEIASAKRQFHPETTALAVVVLAAAGALVWLASALTGAAPLAVVSAAIAFLYLGLMVFKIKMVLSSVGHKPIGFSKQALASVTDDELPFYTILVPLYQEAAVIPQIMEAMTAIDYPADKLEILITLEEYDHETRAAIEAADPPPHVRIVTLPDVNPKTKPKALNVALLQARGEFLVIYDAEIVPEPDQLKKAYLAFRDRPEVACLQTCLDHYNADRNWITKLFNAEFSFHYDLFLPGLQRGGYALPLSGHSTHFRTEALRQIGGWDPYNLTEDCEIGIRLARGGYKTDIIDSRSKEEATDTLGSWIRQRTRWMQGFLQTGLVHLRHPVRLARELGGWGKVAAFALLVPGSVLVNALNLGFWVLLAAWFITGSAFIQSLFPPLVLYVSVFTFALGNFVFMYLNLVGLYKRRRYGLVKYGLLSFAYWLMLGYAAVRACVRLVFRPFQWEKTTHAGRGQTPAPYVPTLAH